MCVRWCALRLARSVNVRGQSVQACARGASCARRCARSPAALDSPRPHWSHTHAGRPLWRCMCVFRATATTNLQAYIKCLMNHGILFTAWTQVEVYNLMKNNNDPRKEPCGTLQVIIYYLYSLKPVQVTSNSKQQMRHSYIMNVLFHFCNS